MEMLKGAKKRDFWRENFYERESYVKS